MTGRARATARSNMALVKYWGKRDETLVLPHTGSLSMTLDALVTETEVVFTGADGPDALELDGTPAAAGEVARATALFDLVRAQVIGLGAARAASRNGFPTAGGLASSASGFAALAAAASWAAGLDPTPAELSILARRASGSACRSVLGGFVEWTRGKRMDGTDSIAVQHLSPGGWDVGMAIAMVDVGRKEVGSRDSMRTSVETSPFYAEWVRTTALDLEAAKAALAGRDLEQLGEIAEHSCLKMHATALAARPPSIFWKPPTLALLEAVRGLRRGGTGAWATIDAGPHVAVLCAGPSLPAVATVLKAVPGVRDVVSCRPGAGVERS